MPALGRFAIYVAVVTAAWGALSGFVGARKREQALMRSAEGALRASATALTVAAAALFYAFLSRDFSLEYVASYSSRSLSTFYTIAAFWAGQNGSLLLWAWVLGLYGAIVVHQNRMKNRELMAWTVPILAITLLFFTALVAFLSNPFTQLPFTPPDGQGLNPLLQNYGQFIHPVTLYMGYVGFTVPFAFAMAALVTGRLNDRWTQIVRRWTLWAWILLTAGVMFGARWAYVELGWGGFWAWDPVENASLMPWFVGTAYLHSVMIQEKKGMLKVWNVSLVAATFALSIFGTFLTRSGVVSSVHSFAASSIGSFLILAVLAVVIGSGALIIWRLPELRSANILESLVSRESSFLLNNLLLVAMAFIVFWGTVYPLVAQAARGVEVSVGAPFFNAFVPPMGVAFLALAGFCPLLAWRKASLRNLRRNFALPLAGGSLAFVGLMLLTRFSHPLSNIVLALSAFVAITIIAEFARGGRARRAVKKEGWSKALLGLFAKNPSRYGGYLVHLGVVVLFVGMALHVSYKQESDVSLSVGESAQIGGYTLTLESIDTEMAPDRASTVATLALSDSSGEKSLGSLVTMKSSFANQEQPATEVAIRSSPVEDLYVILQSADPSKQIASLVLLINPGVFWIWAGALIVLGGGAIAAWPRKEREKKEEVSRETRETAALSS